jgi:hypothetical protein
VLRPCHRRGRPVRRARLADDGRCVSKANRPSRSEADGIEGRMKMKVQGRRIVALCCALITGAAVLYVALAWPAMGGG